MESKRGGIRTAGGDAEGILAINTSAKWEIAHRSEDDIDRDRADSAAGCEVDGIEGPLEGVGGAGNEAVGPGNRSEDDAVAGSVGSDGDRVGTGVHVAVGHMQE